MELDCYEKEIVRRKFCAYCIKVLRGEALNYLKELEKKRKREINFSDLSQQNLEMLYSYDHYNLSENFTVMGHKIMISDEWISEALKKLPGKKREIILMLYFLDMTEEEIAVYLKLVQSTVHYHKKNSLKILKKIWSESAHEIK